MALGIVNLDRIIRPVVPASCSELSPCRRQPFHRCGSPGRGAPRRGEVDTTLDGYTNDKIDRNSATGRAQRTRSVRVSDR
jgi:hypothetical protein